LFFYFVLKLVTFATMEKKDNYHGIFPTLVTLGSISVCYYYYFTDMITFDILVQEDGIFESLTALFLFATAVFLLSVFFIKHKKYSFSWRVGMGLMIAGLIFGAGEEISWGQRIFNIEASDFFKQHNAQQETNLHNMVVGETKINKIVFTYALSIVFGVYFFILPFIYRRNDLIRSLTNRFAIPVPTVFYSLLFLIATGFIMLIDHSRKWELWEFVFAFIIFVIFVNPYNKENIR